MRRWILVLAVVGVVIAGALVLAVVNLDAFVNSNRGVVAERVEAALGREVAFGEVGISFAGGLGVRVADIRVGGDPAFSPDDLVRAEAVDVQVALLPALFGRIEVSRVVLRSPRVHLVLTKEGLSTDSLGGGRGESPPASPSGEPPEPPAEKAIGGAGPALLISLLNIDDGEVRFEDRTSEPPLDLRLTRLDVTASKLTTSEPVDFELRAALFGAEAQNLRVKGSAGPLDAPAPRAELELHLDPLDLDAALELKALRQRLPAELTASGSLLIDARIEGSVDAISFDASLDAKRARLQYGEGFEKPAGAPAELALRGTREAPTLSIDSADLRLGETKLHAKATLTSGDPQEIDFRADAVELRPAAFGAGAAEDVIRKPVFEGRLTLAAAGPRGSVSLRSPAGSVGGGEFTNLILDTSLANERLVIDKLEADAFEGRLAANGSYDMSGETPRFSLDVALEGMQAEPILVAARDADALLTGTVDAELKVGGAGSGWEEIAPSLGGVGSLRVADGELRKFNPAGSTLRALAALPVTSAGALREVIEAHPRAFGMEDTPYESLDARFLIRGRWLELHQMRLTSPEYELAGKGRYSLAGEADLTTQLLFNRELSDELVGAEPLLRYTRTADGRIQIPVALRGRAPKIATVPDVGRLGQTAAREALAEQLLKSLGGPREPENAPAPESGSDPTQPEAPAPSPEAPTAEDLGREVLRQGIEGWLGGQREPQDPEN